MPFPKLEVTPAAERGADPARGLSPCPATLQTWQGGGGARRERCREGWEGRAGAFQGHAETLHFHGVMAGRVQGLSLASVFFWQVALGLSGQICPSLTRPDAELALQGPLFPWERLLEGDLWVCSHTGQGEGQP